MNPRMLVGALVAIACLLPPAPAKAAFEPPDQQLVPSSTWSVIGVAEYSEPIPQLGFRLFTDADFAIRIQWPTVEEFCPVHGRQIIRSLGLYDHRARFYDPGTLSFLEPDPPGPVDSPNLYQAFGFDAFNVTDPFGLSAILFT